VALHDDVIKKVRAALAADGVEVIALATPHSWLVKDGETRVEVQVHYVGREAEYQAPMMHSGTDRRPR
jgi:hypothetical protein